MSGEGELPLGRRAGKSEAAFRTISEVAEELDVPQHVLRFWESKFPQVKPLKRGGGRRYYRPEDLALLRRIRDLLYSEGYTIKGVQKLLREGGHKEAAPPSAEGETKAAPAPELVLPLAAASAAAEDDVEEVGESGADASGDGPAAPLAPAVRRELEGILAELEQLRGLLQPRER